MTKRIEIDRSIIVDCLREEIDSLKELRASYEGNGDDLGELLAQERINQINKIIININGGLYDKAA